MRDSETQAMLVSQKISLYGQWKACKIGKSRNKSLGNSLGVQWLGFHAFTAKGPGWGNKIMQASQHGAPPPLKKEFLKKKRKKEEFKNFI